MASNPRSPVHSWIIGRAADCDLVIAEATVSGHHCRLIREGSQFSVEDMHSPNGVYVNGNRIPAGEPVLIPADAQVTLGRNVPMPWPSEPGVFSVGTGTGQAAPSAPPVPPGARVITIGRSPESDKQIDLPIVSWNHARIVIESGQALLEDLGSRNGTAIDHMQNRIQRAVLKPDSDVYLGSYKISARELLTGAKVSIGESAFEKVQFLGNSMVLGRDPQSDVPLDYPMVSWHHARLTREADGILVEDLGSRNGTFVGGVRINGKVLARPGQEIGLGSYRFQLMEGGQLARREYHGNLTIEAVEVAVNAPNGKRLIEPVSMTVFPSELVALMGPAGAGKTTLLKALNGYTRPAEGRVLFNGASLYDYYDRFRQQLGYVPQDDIVHPQLTVGEALYFSARLRTDLTDDEIRARTITVLKQLGMEDKKDTRIGSPEQKTLSGGQRKRVNIALELINDTPVLFLDEPTSGLSSYDAEAVIELLKNLAKEGKTIISTIHQPSRHIYKQFDDLIMVNRETGDATGAMVYFGPAYPDSIQFFNDLPSGTSQEELSPEMLLSGLSKRRTEEWRRLFKNSRYQQDFVEGRSGKQPAASGPSGADKPRRHFGVTQWIALVKRNTIVKLRDRAQTAILLLQAPVFAVLISLVYQPLRAANGFGELTPKLAGVHFLMVLAAIWFGCNNAARDIVGEWTVYKRERMVTLKLGSYVFSKLAVLFVLGAFQSLTLLGIVFAALHLKGGFLPDLLVLVTSCMVGTGLGLCISAFSRTTESAIALLPIVLLPIVALGGGMRPIYQIAAKYSWVTDAVPSRWAFEANILGETGRDGWKRGADQTAVDQAAYVPLPDLGDPEQKFLTTVDPRLAAEACAMAADEPVDLVEAPTVHGADGKPHPILCSDVAEATIPHYVLAWRDGAGEAHISRAYRGEFKEVNGVRYEAEDFRHRFRTSILVLFGMLSGLVLTVLGILLKRDDDPQ
jgi:ABC-type multidrug transport system ATPase subunit/pSer/pThr/pTyr-binding forkhead associated (FHA) protein